jgi:YVTN family beta-propeller protein
VDGRSGGARLFALLLVALALAACAGVLPAAPPATPVRPPVVATVLARQTATAVAASATPAPWAGYRLLVANRGSGDLTILDPADGRLVGRVAVGEGPWDVVVAPDGRRAYVSIRLGVAVVDLAGERVVQRIGTSFEAQGLALTPDGQTLYVGSRAGGTVARIDVDSTFATDLPAGEWVMGLAISPDGRWVLAPGHYSRSLTVIDAAEGRVVRQLPVDPLGPGPFNLPHYAVISPDGRYAYLPFQGQAIARVTLGAWTVEYFPLGIDAHQHGLAISPDGRRLYVVNVDRHQSLSEIDTADFRELRRIPLIGPHERVILSPDGRTAFLSGGYTLDGQDIVTVVDLAGEQVRTLPSGGNLPTGLALAPRRG